MYLSFTRSVIIIIGICTIILVQNTDAGVIRIKLKTTLSIENGMIRTKVIATNTGSEDALDVRGVLHVFGKTLASEKLKRLDSQKTHTFYIDTDIPENKKGVYPFIGEVRFHDTNLHPFSALSAGTFKIESRLFGGIIGRAKSSTIGRKGKLNIRLTNQLNMPINIRARLFLPYTLTVPDNNQQWVLGSKKSEDFSFNLNNRSGMGGATYPAFCSLEYNINGHHQTVLLRTVIKVKEVENWFIATKWKWLAGLPMLVLLWAGMGIALKKQRKGYGA